MNNTRKWDGFDKTGQYRYPPSEIESWNMRIDDNGTIYYTTHETKPRVMIWCVSTLLTAHLKRLFYLNPQLVHYLAPAKLKSH